MAIYTEARLICGVQLSEKEVMEYFNQGFVSFDGEEATELTYEMVDALDAKINEKSNGKLQFLYLFPRYDCDLTDCHFYLTLREFNSTLNEHTTIPSEWYDALSTFGSQPKPPKFIAAVSVW